MNCTFSTMGKCHAYCDWHYKYLLKNPAIVFITEISEQEYATHIVLEK